MKGIFEVYRCDRCGALTYLDMHGNLPTECEGRCYQGPRWVKGEWKPVAQ